jgi:dihydrofolate reductase
MSVVLARLKWRRAFSASRRRPIGGGVSVIRHYLTAGLIDEMHLAISPVLLGEAEHLFSGINLHKLGFAPYKTVSGENAKHVLIRKQLATGN